MREVFFLKEFTNKIEMLRQEPIVTCFDAGSLINQGFPFSMIAFMYGFPRIYGRHFNQFVISEIVCDMLYCIFPVEEER
jgi:hypothetical protein